MHVNGKCELHFVSFAQRDGNRELRCATFAQRDGKCELHFVSFAQRKNFGPEIFTYFCTRCTAKPPISSAR